MSNINLNIGGRSFTVACADGEEDHVAGLGRMIDGKLLAMGDMAGQSESRMLLFAALLLADEVHEAQHRTAAKTSGILPEDAANRLGSVAERLENLADSLEGASSSA